MTRSLALESLKRHLVSCRMLDRDSTAVIEDLKHPLRMATQYAVDFSEIYSYVFPEKTADEMRVFDDEDLAAERLVQFDALNYMFVEGEFHPVLLPPYAIEMQALVSRIRFGMLGDVLQNAHKALRQMEEALALPEVERLLTVTDSEISDEEVHQAWEVFERNAGALLLLTQDIVPEPLRRITQLVQSRRIVDVSVRSMRHLQIDSAVRDRWFDKLIALRGREKAGASYIDASAMATIHWLNREVGNHENYRIVLVTRSSAMHDVFGVEYREGLWDEAGGYVVRHPRTFASLYRRSSDEEQLAGELMQRQLSLRLFIDAAEARLRSNEPLADEEAQTFLQQMSNIRQAWQQSEMLSSATLIDSAQIKIPEATNKRERLTITLKMLRSRQEFDDLLSRRLSELLVDIERQHESLGFALRAEDIDARDNSQKEILTAYDGKVVLRSNRHWLPYTLQFISTELNLWAESLRARPELNWHEIVDFLQRGFRSGADYERLLAMAYLLASIDKWSVAEQFCDRAIRQPESLVIPRHEGHYFLALCKRMHQESPARYAEALSHLDVAENTKRNWKKDPNYNDPRYIAERGTQIYYWNADIERHHGHAPWTRHGVPRITEARNLWEKALKLVRDDLPLEVQLHNNLCFFYCDVDPVFNEQQTRIHLNALVETAKRAQPDMSKWNALVVDTIAMARLRLHEVRNDDARLGEASKHLKSVLATHELLPKQRNVLEEHLARIEKALAASRGKTVPPPPTLHP